MTHINQRRDPAATWTSVNPVLMLGEVGWETDTRKSKLGDGVTAWNSLPYATQPDGAVSSVNGETGAVVLDKADIGLSNVDNTSDLDKPVSVAQQAALNLKADLDSPTLTGNPTAPTPATADNDTSIATTAFVKSQLADTVLTGNPTAPTPATADNDTSIATTAFVKAQGYATTSQLTVRQSGTVLMSMSAVASGGTQTATVTFPVAFASTPAAFAICSGFVSGSSFAVVKAVDSVTTTQLRIVLANLGSSAATFTDLPVRWIALL